MIGVNNEDLMGDPFEHTSHGVVNLARGPNTRSIKYGARNYALYEGYQQS
jgi:hypothetical protein